MIEEALMKPRRVAVIGDLRDSRTAEEFLKIAERVSGFPGARIIDLAGKVTGSERSVERLERETDLGIVSIGPERLARYARVISGRCRLVVLLGSAPPAVLRKIRNFVGPSSAGVINSRAGLRATAGNLPPSGSVCLISRGRNVTLRILRRMALCSVGVGLAVCTGKGEGIKETEILRVAAADREISVVCLSTAGMRDLLEEVAKVSARKPLLFHPLGEADKLVISAVRQKGGIFCRSIRELVCGAKILSEAPPLTGRRLLVLAQAEDLCLEAGKHLAGFETCELPEKEVKQARLRRLGAGYCFEDSEVLRKRLGGLLASADGCLLIFREDEKEENVARLVGGVRPVKTLAVVHPGRWRPGRFPVFDDPEDAATALRISRERGELERRLSRPE